MPDTEVDLSAVKELVVQVKKGNCVLFLGAASMRRHTCAEWAEYIGDVEPYRMTCPGLPIEEEKAK